MFGFSFKGAVWQICLLVGLVSGFGFDTEASAISPTRGTEVSEITKPSLGINGKKHASKEFLNSNCLFNSRSFSAKPWKFKCSMAWFFTLWENDSCEQRFRTIKRHNKKNQPQPMPLFFCIFKYIPINSSSFMRSSSDIVGALPVLSQLSPSQDLGFLPQGASWSASMSPKKSKTQTSENFCNFSNAPIWTLLCELWRLWTHLSPSFEGQVAAAPTSLSAQYSAPSGMKCDRTLMFDDQWQHCTAWKEWWTGCKTVYQPASILNLYVRCGSKPNVT